MTPAALYHKTIRLAALLHDLGSFAFSHTTEAAYIAYGDTTNKKGGKGLQDDHENLGSFIIKNTDYAGGITQILLTYGFDPQRISDLVKGVDPSIMANQILHSDIDCDRMDYLLRDAYYTGLKYGSYDREYLLHHFHVRSVGDHQILTIKENALHCIEDFLLSRYAWYSQVIRSPRGAKYDALAERLCFYLIHKGLLHKFGDFLDMIENDPLRFYSFNDNYFMSTLHHCYLSGQLDGDIEIKEMAYALLFNQGPRAIRMDDISSSLVERNDETRIIKLRKKTKAKVDEIENCLNKKGTSSDWLIVDIPEKDIKFVTSRDTLSKLNTQQNVFLERDPVKISFDNGDIKLLTDVETSIISKLKNCLNYTPNVFCSHSAYHLLIKEKIIG